MMNRSHFFQAFLIGQTIGLLTYTLIAFKTEGANLFHVFSNNILLVNWSGQFNLDFLCYLTLSGIWIMWRNKFKTTSFLLGLLAMLLGIVLFAPYLLWLTNKENGDLKRVIIGDR